jgi:hypothetical protein
MLIDGKLFAPSEIEALGGPSPGKLTDWRHRGVLDAVGQLQDNGHWGYGWHELLILGLARPLVDDGLELGPAILLAGVASGIVFGWLALGTAADSERWAQHRADKLVVIGVPNPKWKYKVEGRRVDPQLLETGHYYLESSYCIRIDPRDLAGRLDQRLWQAVLDAYLSGRDRADAEWEQRLKSEGSMG